MLPSGTQPLTPNLQRGTISPEASDPCVLSPKVPVSERIPASHTKTLAKPSLMHHASVADGLIAVLYPYLSFKLHFVSEVSTPYGEP